MKKQTKKRSPYIDIVKAILIILVVIGHSIQYGSGPTYIEKQLFFDNNVFKFIYSFHMPLFIMISGYLSYSSLNKNNLKETVISKFKSLIIPILIWSIIPFFILLDYVNIITSIKLFLSVFSTNLWFLWSLFYINILVKIINKYFKDNIFIYILLFLITFILPNNLIIKYFNIQFSLYSYMYFYFMLGYFYKKYNLEEKLKKFINYKTLIINSIIFILLLIPFSKDDYIYLTGINIIGNYKQIFTDLYRYIIGFIGSIEILLLVKYLTLKLNNKVKDTLTYLGKNTLGIYIVSSIIHPYLLPIITANVSNINYLFVIIESIIIILFSIVVIELIKKNKILSKYLLGDK